MPVEVILPRVDMDMTTGKISRWYVRDGDTVKKGAPIFEIETDKAAMEIESPGDGIIRNISAPEGVIVPVGEAVAFIYGEGETVSAPDGGRAAAIADRLVARPDDPAALLPKSEAEISPQPNEAGKIRATPLARSLARGGKLDLGTVSGSGPRGRIIAADVRTALDKPKPMQAQASLAQPPQTMAHDAVLGLYEPSGYELVPHGNMRRTIAQRLVQSKQTVPHFYLSVTCDVSRLVETRALLNDRAPRVNGAPIWRLSLNDFVIKAMALALRSVPDANVTWTEGGMLKHRACDVAVAVAVEGGLFTPVVRAAEAKSLSAISIEMKDLAERARKGKLLTSEYHGGTTSISNLGMYGVEQFSAIINPPQATILAVGAAIDRPIVRDGQIAIAPQMTLTLSCDHRAVDGAVGASLLSAVKAYLEEPSLMLT